MNYSFIYRLIKEGFTNDAAIKIMEKYQRAETASFIRDLLQDEALVNSLSEETDPDAILELLNKPLYSHNISFTDQEYYGHEWSHGDVGIQLGLINEDGSIEIVCDPVYLIEQVFNDKYAYENFIRAVTSIVNHELIHRYQLETTPFDHQVTKRDFQMSSNFDYLSNPKEIDAHARQAVSDFLELGYTVKDIRMWLTSRESIKKHAAESNAFWKYWDYFGAYADSDDDNPEWRRFLKMVYNFLQSVDQ